MWRIAQLIDAWNFVETMDDLRIYGQIFFDSVESVPGECYLFP